MAAISAPRFKIDRSADKFKSFAAGFGATNLQTISGFPQFGPQVTEVHNGNGAASQSAVLTADDASTVTIVLAPGETRVVQAPIKALQASGADVSVLCYWWSVPMKDDQQLLVTPNP